VFYALEDARTPFLVQLPVVATIAGTSYLAGRLLDPGSVVLGVGLGMAAGYTVGAVLSAVLLHRRLGRLDGARVLRTYVRLACAGLPSGLAGWGVSRLVHAVLGEGPAGHAVALALGGLVVLVGYLAACRAMRVTEVDDVAGPLLRRLPGRLATRR
jgi:putative peptidoglycan lipid II flippase